MKINTIPVDEAEPLLSPSEPPKTNLKSLASRAAAVSLMLGCLAAAAIVSLDGFHGEARTGNTLLIATGSFTELGSGHCQDGYYAGWESDKSIATVDGCKQKCIEEPKCMFASLLPGETCSRYDSRAGTCNLGTSDYWQYLAHTTYKKQFQAGYCVTATGADQNSDVIKISSDNVKSPAQLDECFKSCAAYDSGVACEAIWDQGNRGCYVHTQEVDRGNGVAKHACWKLEGDEVQTQTSTCRWTGQCSSDPSCGAGEEAMGRTLTRPSGQHKLGCNFWQDEHWVECCVPLKRTTPVRRANADECMEKDDQCGLNSQAPSFHQKKNGLEDLHLGWTFTKGHKENKKGGRESMKGLPVTKKDCLELCMKDSACKYVHYVPGTDAHGQQPEHVCYGYRNIETKPSFVYQMHKDLVSEKDFISDGAALMRDYILVGLGCELDNCAAGEYTAELFGMKDDLKDWFDYIGGLVKPNGQIYQDADAWEMLDYCYLSPVSHPILDVAANAGNAMANAPALKGGMTPNVHQVRPPDHPFGQEFDKDRRPSVTGAEWFRKTEMRAESYPFCITDTTTYTEIGHGHCLDSSKQRPPYCFKWDDSWDTLFFGDYKGFCEKTCSLNDGCKAYEIGQLTIHDKIGNKNDRPICELIFPEGFGKSPFYSECPDGFTQRSIHEKGNAVVQGSEKWNGLFCHKKDP